MELHLLNLVQTDQHPLKTLYLGGGTPSLLEISDLKNLLKILKTRFEFSSDLEFTMETNPENLNLEYLRALKNEIGVNRLSLGVQSFLPNQLKRLERLATAKKLEQVIFEIQSEFKNFSLDWMIGIPDQTLESFEEDLKKFIEISPPHLSTYILTLPADHKMKTNLTMQKLLVSDEGVQNIYLKICDALRASGYEHYEISNFSKPGFRSKHNSNYWNSSSDYLALGPGAHGYLKNEIERIRYENIRDPLVWSSSDFGFENSEVLNAEQQKLENFYLRLRTRQPVFVSEVNESVISPMLQEKWIKLEGNEMFLTESGWLLMESIAEKLLP